MADKLFPPDVNNALDASPVISNPQTGGALTQVSQAQPAAALPTSLFSGSNPYQEKLFDLLSKPPVDESSKWLNFASGMGAPTKTGSFGESMASGLAGLAKGESEEEALKQKYKMALIEQYALLARQQQALNMTGLGMPGGGQPQGSSMPGAAPGQTGGMMTTGAGGAPVQPSPDTPVPGYYGLTRRDIGALVTADPTGKALQDAKEKRATASQRAGNVLFNMDPNTGQWVANGSSMTAHALLQAIDAQISANTSEVRIPMSDGTEKVVSRADALHLKNDLSQLVGAVSGGIGAPSPAEPAKPQVSLQGDVGSIAEDAKRLPPGEDKNLIEAALRSQQGGAPQPAAPAQPAAEPVVAGVSQAPDVTKAKEDLASYSASIPKEINQDADIALQSQTALGELRNLMGNFNPGKAAPLRQALSEYAQTMGLQLNPGELNAASSMEAFNKIALGLATQAAKQLSSRPSQLEFQKMVESNPNIALLPEGLQKIIFFTEFKNNLALQKQQEFYRWAGDKKPTDYAQFLPYWNQKVLDRIKSGGSMDTAPTNRFANFKLEKVGE